MSNNRKTIDPNILSNLQNKEWLEQKIIQEKYSVSRLAKEFGTTRTTVEKYRVLHSIPQFLSQKELTTLNYQTKSNTEKEQILEKRKQTNQQLFGVDNTFQSPEKQQKIKETMLERYGVERALQSPDILDKQHNTMLERYGEKFAMNNDEIKAKVVAMMKEKYGSNPFGNLDIQKVIKETNLEKYGREYATQKHIPLDVLEKMNDRDWLIDQHHTQKKTLSQIAKELGFNDITTVYRYCVKSGVEIKYYYESAQQREVSDWLTSLDIKVESNIRNIINGELDIYLPDYNIAIEYCGVFWHCDFHPRMTRTYHLDKLKQCQNKGVRLLTIYEDEWVYRKDIVKRKVVNILGGDKESVFARKCQIISITNNKIKKDFFDSNHIQGSGPGSVTYGLKYNNDIVAMMTFIQKPNGVFDLNRYASSIRVVGGFQKLLNHFQKNHEYVEILSFADLRWSEGNMYDKSGFVLDKTLPPDYSYVIGNKTHHKFRFRRKALETFLPFFNPVLSETVNMANHGYYKIYNCGLLRYVLKKKS